MTIPRTKIGRIAALLLIALTVGLFPHERRLSFTTESRTLPKGTAELEWHSTFRIGRQTFYSAFDERIEAEFGLHDRFLMAFYLNGTWEHALSASGVESKSMKAPSLSVEAKWRLSDSAADALGFALYGEVTAKPHEVELEGKLILDKQAGPVLIALNLGTEGEFAFRPVTGLWETETTFMASMGAAWVKGAWGIGLECRSSTVLSAGTLGRSTLAAGPAFSVNTARFWLSLTPLIQFADLAKAGASPNLTAAEQVEARLILGIPF